MCTDILSTAWQEREGFIFHCEPVAETIARARQLTDGPVVIADYGDNAGAGGQMDDMTVVREIVRQGLQDVAVGPIWDPQSLAQMQAAGVGAQIELKVHAHAGSSVSGGQDKKEIKIFIEAG